MKRSLLILPLLGVALFVLLWVYVQSDHFADRIRPFIAGPLQEVMGPGSRVGWIKANLLPPYLEVRDVVIPSAASPEALAIRKIKIYLNPFPLLWKKISIPALTVLEPRIVAVRASDGSVDLADLLRSVAAKIARKGAGGPSAYDIDIRTIIITNGSARFSDAASKADVRVTKLNMTARIWGRRTSVDVRSLTARVAANVPAYPRIEADLHAALTADQRSVTIRDLSLVSPDMRLTAEGGVGMGPEDPIQLKLSFRAGASQRKVSAFLRRKLDRPQPGIEVSLAVTGRRSAPVVDGTAKLGNIRYSDLLLEEAGLSFSYRDHEATVTGEKWQLSRKGRSIGTGNIQLKARYDRGTVLIDAARIAAEDAELTATGRIDPAGGYDLAIAARSWSNGTLLSLLSGLEVRGNLSASGRLTGPVARPAFLGTFSGGPFSVHSVPFASVMGTVSYTDAVLSLGDAVLVQGRSRYAFEGSINAAGAAPVFSATLKAVRSDVASVVALFYRSIPLDITATGTLSFTGTTADFSGAAKLDLEAGSAYGESFDGGSLTAELSSKRISFPSVLLRKKGGTVKGSGWIGFDGTYAARIDGTGVDLAAIDRLGQIPLSGPLDLSVTSSGSFSQPVVRARAEVSPLSSRGYEIGDAEGDLTIEGGMLGLTLAVQRDDGASVDASGSLKLSAPYAWSASAKVHAADLSGATFSENIDILAKTRFSVDASAEIAGSGANADSVGGDLRIPRLVMTVGDYRIENEGDVRLHLRGGRMWVDSLALSGQGTKVSLSGSAGIASGLDLKLTGDGNLSLLRFATRAIEHGDGIATTNVRITDAWSDPNISGELTIRNGIVKVRDIPQRFSGLTGTISFDRNRVVTEGLRGDFGGGTISVDGTVQLKNLKLVDFTSKTLMDNVTFRYPPGLTATVGGTLFYDGNAASQTLSGDVNIRRARYDRRVDFKTMLVDLSRGFKPKSKEDLGLVGETKLDVHVSGKEDIILENNVAKIPFELDLLLRGTVNRVQLLGHMETKKGEVYFRKIVFHILRASADFADPNRINPVIDAEAETQVREYQIRVTVTGSADHAVVAFSSEPPLTDSNILALLTIGRRTEDIRGKESEVGQGEAIGIVTGPVQDIVESRARTLTGLDRFQVDPYFSKADVPVPRVTAGKEIVKDRVYITYSANVGAAIPEQAFSVEYLVNRNVSLVGGRNDIGDIGADIKFRFSFR